MLDLELLHLLRSLHRSLVLLSIAPVLVFMATTACLVLGPTARAVALGVTGVPCILWALMGTLELSDKFDKLARRVLPYERREIAEALERHQAKVTELSRMLDEKWDVRR